MKHAIYENPLTGKFALIRVPPKFAEGDKLPIPSTVQWLNTRDEVVAALSHLLDLNEDEDTL
jgi:hypothetical protein